MVELSERKLGQVCGATVRENAEKPETTLSVFKIQFSLL